MVAIIWCSLLADAAASPGASTGWRPVTMEVTAYCRCKTCCGPSARGVTSSGKPADGRIVAAPDKYAFGTRMRVPGYGEATVEDRSGLIRAKGRRAGGRQLRHDRLDILMPTHDAARQWGRRIITVQVKDPPSRPG